MMLHKAVNSAITMSSKGAHILLFPYPAPGHIIPLLGFAHQLVTRGLTITVLVTPSYLSLLQPLLSTHPPDSVQSLILSPPEVHPTPGLFRPIAMLRALSELRDPISKWFKAHPSPPKAIVSDVFLGWTNNLSSDLGVPRVVFSPSGAFAFTSFVHKWRDLPKPDDPDDDNSMLTLTNFPGSPKCPWWQISHLYRLYKEGDPNWEFFRGSMLANAESWGYVFNSFTELEGVYLEYLKKEIGHNQVWAVGPVFPSEDGKMCGGSTSAQTSVLMDWLDSKGDNKVVYISFESRGDLGDKQINALAIALESTRVDFIWALKESELQHFPSHDFEDRVEGRGILIKGWAPHLAILRHRAVGVFVTHCGWNSVLEGLSTGKLLLTWPLNVDQFSNTKLLVDELGLAIRLCNDGNRVVPSLRELTRCLNESTNDSSREVRERVNEIRKAASEALKGGSSIKDTDEFVEQLCSLGH